MNEISRKITASLVMKIEYPDETIIHFTGHFDEEKIKEKLEQVRMLCQRDDQSLGVIVFGTLKYNPYWFGFGMLFKN